MRTTLINMITYKCTLEYLISSRFVGIAMQYMPKRVISRFYSINSPVFLEYGLIGNHKTVFHLILYTE